MEQRRVLALCRQRALPMLGGIHTVDRVRWEREARNKAEVSCTAEEAWVRLNIRFL